MFLVCLRVHVYGMLICMYHGLAPTAYLSATAAVLYLVFECVNVCLKAFPTGRHKDYNYRHTGCDRGQSSEQ